MEILHDIDHAGKERPWRKYKIASQILADIYLGIDIKKSARLRECASFLIFGKNQNGMKLMKLKTANFCRVRLCPICTWRRGLKIFAQIKKIINYIGVEKHGFVLLTLTVKNCSAGELNETLNRMTKAFNLLTRRKAFKNAFLGFFRSIEITHDMCYFINSDMWYGNKSEHIYSRKKYYQKMGLKIGDENPNFNNYHPHIHCLLITNKSYAKSQNYLSHQKLTKMWSELVNQSTAIVDIRQIKGNNLEGAISEVAKYSTKSSDFINVDDFDLTIDTVSTLDKALNKRRFIAFGGLFKEVHKLLNLSDAEEDLIHIDDESKEEEESNEICFSWRNGLNHYYKI